MDVYDNHAGLIEGQKHQHRTTRDKADRATVNQVLDPRTRRFLNSLKTRGAFGELGDCVSTGKEANVYSGTPAPVEGEETETNNGSPLAIKIYKTSILVFKDRSKYVVGEHRFTSQSKNPRQMVQQWAEKEFRNLKRIHQDPLIYSPAPVDIKQNVLVMQYLTMDGGASPSPKLRDHPFADIEEVGHFYLEMLVLMRALYQRCHLVHADLSEYNTIVHEGKLYVFDVSQSVEPSHPMALDFLRMDIKNINDFFSRTKKINVYSERDVFNYIITPEIIPNENLITDHLELKEKWLDYLHSLPLKTNEDDDFNDQIFRSLHLITSLHQLDEDDYSNFKEIDTLGELVGKVDKEQVKEDGEFDSVNESDSDDEFDSDGDSDGDDYEDNDGLSAGALRQKKNQDKSLLKAEKAKMKEENREKRKTKMKKHIKKRLVKKSSNKKNAN